MFFYFVGKKKYYIIFSSLFCFYFTVSNPKYIDEYDIFSLYFCNKLSYK